MALSCLKITNMKQFLHRLYGLIALVILGGSSLTGFAQTGVLDPNDPIVVYNPQSPPPNPSASQMTKWVKSNRMSWNTSSFKAYIYKGVAFRLKFPKTYQHNVADGKTYPLFVFFHGIGERGTIYDNEYQLLHGGQHHMTAVDNGKFDGFLLYIQSATSSGSFGSSYFDILNEIIENYLIPQVKVDPFRVVVNGLSAGGTSVWDFTIRYPRLVAAATPISAASLNYRNSADLLKWIPIWHFQGELDNNPTPGTSKALRDAVVNAGGNYRYTEYEGQGHGCWNSAWGESEYFDFLNKAHKANPWPLTGKAEFCPGDPIQATLGVSAGFSAYEWRRNGQLIPNSNTNQITVNQLGTYECRIRKGNTWSPWSPIPVVLKMKDATIPPNITISGLMSKVIPAPDGNNGVTLAVPQGYSSYVWQKVGSGATLGTTYKYTATSPGEYRVQVREQFGCSSEFSAPFTVVNADGPNKPDPAINLTVSTVSKTSLRLNWSDNPAPQYNETNFEIYQAEKAGGPYKLVGITGPDVLTFTVEGLNAKTTYYYRVRPVNNTGAAALTPEASGTTDADTQAPTAPTNLRIEGSTRSSVTLKWDAASDDVGVTKYDIYINGKKSFVTENLTYTVHNLEHGQSYNFTVKARDFAGNVSPASNQVTGQPLLSGLNYKYYTFTGNWNNLPDFNALTPVKTGNVPNVTIANRTQDDNFAYLWEGYIIIPQNGNYTFRTRSDDGSKLYLGNRNQVNSPYSFSATALVNNDGLHGTQDRDGTRYLEAGVYPIAITFYEQGGGEVMEVFWSTPSSGGFVPIPNSAFSEASTPGGSAPAAPSNLTATAVSYNKISLSWTDNSNNETGFEIWRSTSPSDGFNTVGTAPANATTYTDSGLVAATRYYYRIRAIGQYGESAFDNDGAGVDYAYYETGSLSVLPDFNTLTPVKTGRTPTIALGMQNRNDNFAVKFSGKITVPTTGTYTFYTSSDDGSKLYIGEFTEANRVVNNDGLHGTAEQSGTKYLEAGTYPIHVTFFEAGGSEVLTASIAGPGIPKQQIPASMLGEPNANAQTFALPAAPAAPSDVTATATSTSSITVTWTDNATNEDKIELYRSANNNSNYVLHATLPADATSFEDAGLFANAGFYYKVRAVNVGGASAYSNEANASTQNNIPVLNEGYGTQYMRYGTVLELPVTASDVDPGTLNVSVTNLPSFGTYISNGNGSGLIRFTPGINDQQTYNNITVTVSDANGGTASFSFNLVVNDNYSPVLGNLPNVNLNETQTSQNTLTATDQNASDVLTWTFTGLPSFVSVSGTTGNSVQLSYAPGFADGGTYKVGVSVSDGRNGVDTGSFVINVADINPNKRILVNFNSGITSAPAPWNNTNKPPVLNDVFGPFKDETGANTTVGIKIMSNWQAMNNGTNEVGMNTGNNSGVYPDAVISTAYWSSTAQQTFNITGLNVNSKYNLTFFGSRSGTTADRTSIYTVKGVSVTVNAAMNTQNTATIANITPDAGGVLTVTLKNAPASTYSYINAMVIEELYDDQTAPAKVRNLAAELDGSQVNLTWVDAAYNEDSYQIYRATSLAGPFSLQNTNAKNTSSYVNTGILGNTTYYYFVRGVNAYGSTDSDTITVVSPNVAPVISGLAENISMKTDEVLNLTITATDAPGDVITLSASGLPPFASFTDNGNGSGTLTLTPGSGHVGSFPGVTITATDDKGATSSKVATIAVADKNVTTIYVNFNQLIPVGAPWNSFNAFPYANTTISNLKDVTNTSTGISITLVDAWGGANDVGATTGNNSGVFPDDVMQTAYFESTTNTKRIRISGLPTNRKYNLAVFASRVASDVRNTIYSAGGKSATLNVSNNTTNVAALNGLSPNASGIIELSVTKAAGASYAYIGALMINSYVDNGLPLPPSNLAAVAKSKTSIQLTWSDKSDNETGFELYRSNSASGPYTLIATLGANATSYNDQGLTANTAYYYKVRAKMNAVFSEYSNTASASTFAYSTFININRDNPAAAPWYNTNAAPQEGMVFDDITNEQGNISGLTMTITKNFSGDNPFGMNTGTNSGVFPDNVIRSTWWVDAGSSAKLKFGGLSQAMKYSFVFFASRDGVPDKTSVYTINGKSVSLQAAYNVNNTVQLDDIVADENGEVELTITLGPNSSFAYLGAVVIHAANIPDDDPANGGTQMQATGTALMPTVQLVMENSAVTEENIDAANLDAANLDADADHDDSGIELKSVKAFPNPFRDELQIQLNLRTPEAKLKVQIVDQNGRAAFSQTFTNIPAGPWSQRLDTRNKITAPGVYVLQVVPDRKNAKPVAVKVLKIK